MPWARRDDQSNGNAKLLALSNGAERLWGRGLVYCAANLSNGSIPDHVVPTLGVRFRNLAELRGFVDELCTVLVPGKDVLWHRVPGGFEVHDYLDWNDDRETILKSRKDRADRITRFRARLKASKAVETLQAGERNASRNALQAPLPNACETAHDTALETHSVHPSTPTTKDQDHQEQSRRRATTHSTAALREPEDSPQVLLKLAHTVLDLVEIDAALPVQKLWTENDIEEELNTLAARAGLRYDGDRVTKALASARAQRAHLARMET